MRALPDYLKQRYETLDELFSEPSADISNHSLEPGTTEPSSTDPGVRLMCKFWNILQENPDFDLKDFVQQRMASNSQPSGFFKPQEIMCFMVSEEEKTEETADETETDNDCCKAESELKLQPAESRSSCQKKIEAIPLSKVLCDLNQVALIDKKCRKKIKGLKEAQHQAKNQIKNLELREKEELKLLKQADCMWTCMEQAYKQKVAEATEREKILLEQKKEVDASLAKWSKNKKDLEFQVKNVDKCQQEIKEKILHKNSDLKCIDMEIAGLKKRHDQNMTEIDKVKKLLSKKKEASDVRMSILNEQLQKLHQVAAHERELKDDKEREGSKYVKESREDLQNLCRVLLQKRLENEDLRTECNEIEQEIESLKKTINLTKEENKNKEHSIQDELKKINEEVANFKVRCTTCHASTDSDDTRRFCTDCPKCLEVRECLYADGHCTEDSTTDCVCMTTKHKFLNNVFENMYTVLERQVQTRPGQVLAEQVMECLKISRNGKLDDETRKALQDFILVTVKKNLNLTIIGGAVKTRCEMDSDTYKQLMTCLQLVKVTKPNPEMADKGTLARKDPCHRWGSDNECNCPYGPTECICTRKAPPPPNDPTPYPQLEEDKEGIGKAAPCPHKDDTLCGPDCANVPDTVKELVASWKPDSCAGPTCTFSKNMRAAQCMLGPESVNTATKFNKYMPTIPCVPNLSNEMKSNCACGPDKPWDFYGDDERSTEAKGIEKSSDFVVSTHPQKTGTTCKRNIISSREKRIEKVRQQKQQIHTKPGCNCSLTEQEASKCFNNKNARKVKNMDKIMSKETNEDVKENAKEEINRIFREETGLKLRKNRVVPQVQDEVWSKAYRESGTEPYITFEIKEQREFSLEQVVSSLTKANTPKNLFKVAITDESGEENQEFTEMTTTSSGSIKMALDEKTIQIIENTTKENPNLFVTLKKTLSGHLVVKFNKFECNASESRRIVVNRTDSGKILMEVHKDLVNTIQPSIFKKTDAVNLLQSSSVSIELTTKTGSRKQNKQPFYGEYLMTPSKRQSFASNDILGHETVQSKLVRADTITNTGQLFTPQVGQQNHAFKINSSIEKQFKDKLTNSENFCSKLLEKSSCSDSHLYEQVKIQSQKSLLTESSAILKKTASGKYAFVVNKESKASFINNLMSYISNSVHRLIPIKRTNEGDIVLCLNQDQESNTHYGSLKITSSGNTYIFINERVIKEMENTASARTAQTISDDPSVPSVHMIGTVMHPQNKGETTTCHGKPDSCSCDKSKCVCKELPTSVRNYWGTTPQEEENLDISWNKVTRNPDGGYKTCHPNTCVEVCASNSQMTFATESEKFYQARDESPEFRILRCFHPRSGTNQKHREQCYYFIESTCPTDNCQYNSEPKDLKHIAVPLLHNICNNETVISEYDYENK